MNKLLHATRTLCLLVLIVLTPKTFAWGADGHRVTGEIAWQFLAQDAQKQVAELLQSAGEPSLAEAATWADRIRSNEDYNWAAPLHYINLPEHWDGYQASRDCPPAGCILKAIEHFRGVLGDATATESARAEALLFIAHFVGDLHQPLHTGRAADRGGNDIAVTFFGAQTNLHALWDTYLPAGFIGDWKNYADAETRGITPAERSLWLHSAAVDWAEESHALAYSNAYTREKRLGETYYTRNRDIVALRLRQGGVRLAGMIESALAHDKDSTRR
ncbi:S1/P1 nuclease [Microbulbifer hainanensis]|uniref:S1/P1 nuclease n=1 Tax=Microbulbifer hainanensis TaxID=2735675 RepID=UPI001869440C|nr:S1/P1 nuclease [Microbulbifer hainanensis]